MRVFFKILSISVLTFTIFVLSNIDVSAAPGEGVVDPTTKSVKPPVSVLESVVDVSTSPEGPIIN